MEQSPSGITQLTRDELQLVLDRAGSWKRFKEILGISHEQLKSLIFHHELHFLKLRDWSQAKLEGELKRLGSSTIFCIVHQCKESELRARLREHGLDLKLIVTPNASTIGIGRKGELYFKEIRGQMVAEDCFETQGHTAPYDLFDLIYKRVNVKTACVARFKAKTRMKDPNYWYFSTKGWENCDTMAFVPLGPDGKPRILIVAEANAIGQQFPKHLVMTGWDIRPASDALMSCQNNFNELQSLREYLLFPSKLKASLKKQNVSIEASEVQSMLEDEQVEHPPV